MKILPLLFTLMLFAFAFSAESQVIQEWMRTYDYNFNEDIAYDMAVDNSGNIYVTGKSYGSSSSTYIDFATVKYNQSGQEIWVKRYSSPVSGSNDRARDVSLDSAGNVYVSGTSYNDNLKNMTTVIKYSPAGNEEWIRRFNFIENESNDFLLGAEISSDGNLYATGYTYDSSMITNPLIIKYSLDGKRLWCIINTSHKISLGTIPKIVTDINGNVYVGANVENNSTLIMKYNSDGVLQWETINPGVMSSISTDPHGFIFVCGVRNYYALTLKINTEGTLMWDREFRSTAINGQAQAYSIGFDNENNIYTLGWDATDLSTSKDILLVKYDEPGNLLWYAKYNSTIAGLDEGHELAFDNYDNIYVLGISRSNNIINLKFDSTGNLKWLRTIFSGRYNAGIGIFVDNLGNVISATNIYVSGQYTNYATIKYSQGTGIQLASNILPANYELFPNYPNPFNSSTIIRFSLPVSEKIYLKVYDQIGKEIATLANGFMNSGTYEVLFDASSLSSGIYFYSLYSDEFMDTKKMLLLK